MLRDSVLICARDAIRAVRGRYPYQVRLEVRLAPSGVWATWLVLDLDADETDRLREDLDDLLVEVDCLREERDRALDEEAERTSAFDECYSTYRAAAGYGPAVGRRTLDW